jgi:hypothetical protein
VVDNITRRIAGIKTRLIDRRAMTKSLWRVPRREGCRTSQNAGHRRGKGVSDGKSQRHITNSTLRNYPRAFDSPKKKLWRDRFNSTELARWEVYDHRNVPGVILEENVGVLWEISCGSVRRNQNNRWSHNQAA